MFVHIGPGEADEKHSNNRLEVLYSFFQYEVYAQLLIPHSQTLEAGWNPNESNPLIAMWVYNSLKSLIGLDQ